MACGRGARQNISRHRAQTCQSRFAHPPTPCWLLCVPRSAGSFHAATSCRYFYIPARKEHRGIGGLFFDDLEAEGAPYDVQAYVQVGTRAMGSPLPCAGTCALQPGKLAANAAHYKLSITLKAVQSCML